MVALLLVHGAEVNATRETGQTPLALGNHHSHVVDLLRRPDGVV